MALGTQLWYSDTNNPSTETWTLETAKIKVTITDAAIGKPRTLEAIIVNTVNASTGAHEKELIYTRFKRVKIVEYNTSLTIFVGRVEFTQPTQDASYGQILIVYAADYLQTLLDRKINTSYGTEAVPILRSAMITQIIADYNLPNLAVPITTNIDVSPSGEKIFRQYTGLI